MTTKFRIVDVVTDEVIGSFDNYFDARDYVDGRGNLAIETVSVDDDGFDVEDFDEYEEPDDIDSDFGFDPYMGEYTYDC